MDITLSLTYGIHPDLRRFCEIFYKNYCYRYNTAVCVAEKMFFRAPGLKKKKKQEQN